MADKLYSISVRYSFCDLGGKGEHTSTVSYETVQLMMKSPFVTIGNKTIKVNSIEVTDKDTVNFYGDEISLSRGNQTKEKDLEEMDLEEIAKWL